MIGRQSTILATNEDLLALEHMLRARQDVQILSNRTNEVRNSLLPLKTLQISSSDFGRGPLVCYLVQAGSTPRIDIEPLSDVKVQVGVEASELIEFRRPYCADGVIKGNRVFYATTFFENGELHEKRSEFVKWADEVVKAIRRFLTYDKGRRAYLGPDAAARIASGELRVVT